MSIIIRKATPNDIPKLCQLYSEFYHNNASLQPKYCRDTLESGDYPSTVINSKTGILFVAELKKEVVGFIHLEQEDTPNFPSVVPHKYGVLMDLFVSKSHRRKGVASHLLSEANQWLLDNQLEYMELMVLNNNSDGISLYERNGFKTKSHIMRWEPTENY